MIGNLKQTGHIPVGTPIFKTPIGMQCNILPSGVNIKAGIFELGLFGGNLKEMVNQFHLSLVLFSVLLSINCH